jgi:hydrogenase maturation protease
MDAAPAPLCRLLVGIGNAFRRDDGAGIAAARRAAARHLPGLEVAEASGEGAGLMDLWRGRAEVHLVDAVRSGARPGTVFRFEASSGPLPTRFFSYSTHAFSVAEAVETARALGELPPRLVVHGVEGENFDNGEGLSPCVEAGVASIMAALLRELGNDDRRSENHDA